MKREDKVARNIYYHCLEYDHEQLGDLYLVACGMEDADPGVITGPDLRDGFHLHVVRSGKGILRIAGEERQIREGQMFILKDGEEAYYRSDEEEPWSYCWVTYNGSDARRITEEIGFREGIYILDTSIPAEGFFETVRRMHLRPEMNRINELYQKGIMIEYLAMAMEAGGHGAEADEKRRHRPTEEYMERAASFIHYNYRTIEVKDLVRFIGFSRGYLTTAFKRVYGISVQEYLLRVRMQKAKELLKATELQIQEIGARVGYEDQLNFSRIFRKYEGISPSEYRRRANGTETDG